MKKNGKTNRHDRRDSLCCVISANNIITPPPHKHASLSIKNELLKDQEKN